MFLTWKPYPHVASGHHATATLALVKLTTAQTTGSSPIVRTTAARVPLAASYSLAALEAESAKLLSLDGSGNVF